MNEIKQMLMFLHLDQHPLAEIIQELAMYRVIPKHTKIISPDTVRPYIIFLVSGLLRGYLEDKNGGEITDCFSFRYGDSRISFMPSVRHRVDEYVETLEDTRIILFDLEQVMPHFLQEPMLMDIYMKRISEVYAEQVLHKRMLCHTTAMERYRWFLEEYPGLIDRAPHRHIASFLNITPVTLSRLRREERKDTLK